MQKTNPMVIAMLLAKASAVQLEYRPPSGSVPWGGAAARPTWDTPDYPVNYFVPNFGVDHNILTTFNSLKIAEQGQKKKLKATFAQSDAPRDIRIPDLGADEDVRNSLAAIDEAQHESGKSLVGVKFAQNAVRYAPSTGPDSEIADLNDSINLAEKKFNHKLTYETEHAPTVAYAQKWQQLGSEEDVVMTQANIAESEKMYGQFVPVKDYDGLWRVGKEEQNVVQLDADIHLDSDPICNSAGCTQYKHPESKTQTWPINYSVPNFGQDRDISNSVDNAKVAEGIVGHEWTWKEKKKPKQPKYPGAERGLDSDIVASLDNMAMVEKAKGGWDLVQLNADISTDKKKKSRSDPICSSAGCTQYKHPEGKSGNHPMDYGVPNFGMDRDIMGSLQNMPVAEKIVGHQWSNFGTEESKKKWSNPAKKVLYNFDPALDGNIRDSIKNLADTETTLKHKYELLQTGVESDPICSSAGCGQYKHPASTEASYPMDYGVPSFGMDRDISGSLDNLAVAEGIVKHAWGGIDKAKYSNPAKKVMYNFAPKLDGDIVDSQKNLSETETKLEHKYALA